MDIKTDRTYVIGHINPDTDSIAAAMGYAWYLRQDKGVNAIAARAGQLNPQTLWVLKRLEMEAPILLPDASPRFEAITNRFDTTTPDRPLREAWAIANRTGGIAPIVATDGSPYGLLTGLSLFEFLSQSIGPHPKRENIELAELLEESCRSACDTEVPKFLKSNRIRDSISRILREERSEFWVVDDEGRYVGICRQRDALSPPRLRLILVDHNEASQALGALDEADLVEILDHHRLGNPTTHTPIRCTVDVVGSTSTLVSERIEEAGLSAPPSLAGLLLAGLVSDTLILSSPTTTKRDHIAAERLRRWGSVGGSKLEGETVHSFGEQVLQAGTGLASRSPKEIVTGDLKLYEAGGFQFGIAQAEVNNLHQISDNLEKLRKALTNLKDTNGLDFAILMVTDVVRGVSQLIFTEEIPQLGELPYPRVEEGIMMADGIVSRKMQFLPVVLSALEG